MRERIAAIVGPAAVWTGGEAGRWAVHGVAPRAVAAPASAEEAAELLALASREGWAVELAGAGGWLDAGRPPARLDLVVTTERMAALEAHEPADLVATAGAGLPLRALVEHLAPHRQWLPLDPPAHAGATLGAVVSLAGAGPLREAHGTPRDHVLGLRLVTGDGRILDLGGKVVKNVAGYDLVRLVVGSRGTLGLVARVHVRLRPLPERDATLRIGAAEAAPLVGVVGRLREERIDAAALELLSGLDRADAGLQEDAWTLWVRLQGNGEAVADAEARVRALAGEASLVVERVEARGAGAAGVGAEGAAGAGSGARAVAADGGAGARTAPMATGAGVSASDVWRTLSEAEASAALCVRLADAPARLGETLALARALCGTGTAARIAAHAGAGIVRVIVPAAQGGGFEPEAWASAIADTRAELAARGGSAMVANGPAALLERVEPFGGAGPALRLMRALKTQFDPAGVLAPGRFVV